MVPFAGPANPVSRSRGTRKRPSRPRQRPIANPRHRRHSDRGSVAEKVRATKARRRSSMVSHWRMAFSSSSTKFMPERSTALLEVLQRSPHASLTLDPDGQGFERPQ